MLVWGVESGYAPTSEPERRPTAIEITDRIGASAPPGRLRIRRRPRTGRRRRSACGAVAIALLCAGPLAGCGGGAHASPPRKVMSGALAYANCMRSHGVPDFPDPNGQGEFQIRPVKVENGRPTPTEDLVPSSPAFQAAERVCGSVGTAGRQVTPAQEKQEFRLTLEAAECMRANGVPNYPDPKWLNGSIDANYNPSLNINPSSPAFSKAAKKCAHGLPLLGSAGG